LRQHKQIGNFSIVSQGQLDLQQMVDQKTRQATSGMDRKISQQAGIRTTEAAVIWPFSVSEKCERRADS
jgi:hypothetical protein